MVQIYILNFDPKFFLGTGFGFPFVTNSNGHNETLLNRSELYLIITRRTAIYGE